MTTCCDDPDCYRGTPRPGRDFCKNSVHGHVDYDGMCMECLEYGPHRERYDHVDACAFWRKQECDCTLNVNGTMYVECSVCKGRKVSLRDKCLCPEMDFGFGLEIL